MSHREPSAAFQQFKEAFQLIDHDKDGALTEPDLRHIFASLGLSPSKHTLDTLLASRPGAAPTHDDHPGINFTMFLTMMTERLFEFDPDADLRDAFECFDEADTGLVNVDEMRKWMGEVGERMDKNEIDKFFNSSFTDRHGNFNYREWIKVLRVNDDGNDSQSPS